MLLCQTSAASARELPSAATCVIKASAPHVVPYSFCFFSLFSPTAVSRSRRMDSLAIYAIAAGGIFVMLFLTRTVSTVTSWMDLFSIFVSRHLTLPFVIHRNRFCGPWTRAGVLIHLSYAAVNIFLIFFRIKSLTGAGRRAGELALVNLIFPLSTIHLNYLADLLGIRWSTYRKIHRATGWMAVALLLFHIIIAVKAQGFVFPLHEQQNLFTMLVWFIKSDSLVPLTCDRPQSHWVSLACFPFHGFVNGPTRSFFEDIRSSPGSLSTASGSISHRRAIPQGYISWSHWGLLD